MKNILLLALTAIILTACTTVDPTEVGMKISKAGAARGITKENIVSGYVTYFPLTTEVITYPISTQTYTWSKTSGDNKSDESFSFQTSDSVTLSADVSFSYKINPDSAPSIYKAFGGNIERITHTNIHNIVRDSITRTSSGYKADQVLGGARRQFEDETLSVIKASLEPIGFEVQTFAFVGEIVPPVAVRQAINAKFTAQQSAIQAQNKVVQAKAEADQGVALATGEAQSILVKARAQAQANIILARSLTPTLVQSKQIERWDGHLPTVQGQMGGLLLNLPTGKK